MNFELKTLTPAGLAAEKCDALLVLIPQGYEAADDALSGWIQQALESGDFEAKAGTLLPAYRVAGFAARRIVLVGAGDRSTKSIRTAMSAAMNALKASNVRSVTVFLGALGDEVPDAVRTAVLACSDAAYVYQTTKAIPKGSSGIGRVVLVVTSRMDVKTTFERSVALVSGLELAKEWANRPANYATPVKLAEAATELAAFSGIKVEVLGPKEVQKLGMGAFSAVAQGSGEPLRFIVLRYQGADKKAAPVVLIGKGITFDTGGISIKPAAEMDEMKFDMAGAASVIGTFRVLAELKPALNVVGLIAACENMPDGHAVKPGDVVTSMSGQTIEILNTDAEGRLVLCDALTYAERFKPSAVIDIATLTGACVVALGAVRSGLFSSDDALAAALLAAGETSQDLCWRMPLDDDYAEGLKTNFADVANIAGRAGGAVTAAKFLQRFAGKFPWAHLDIAGTAWKGGSAKGATGRPVGLLIAYLLNQAMENGVQPSAAAAGKKTKRPRSRA